MENFANRAINRVVYFMKNITVQKKNNICDSVQRGSLALEELRRAMQYRDLIYQLIRRDIVARYKRSIPGCYLDHAKPTGYD